MSRHFHLYYDAYWQPAVEHASNYRLQLDTGLDIPLYRGLNFSLLFSFTRENTVITGIQREDKLLGFGLSYYFIKT